MDNTKGYIYGINGPVVQVKGSADFEMQEMVYVGYEQLIGEVIGVTDEAAIVQVYEDTASGQLCTLYMRLSDEPGVLSHVLQQLYQAGANILTVNQNIPVDTVAVVTISVEINKDKIDMDEVLKELSAIYGVVSVKRI